MRHRSASFVRVRNGTRCAGLCIVLLLWAARAHASPPFELTGSVLSSGGLSARTTGASAGSAYFNPALLSKARPGVEAGVFVLQDSIQINLGQRNPSFDIPEAAIGQFGGQMPSLPTTWAERGCDPQMGGRCVSKLQPNPRRSATNGATRTYFVLGLVANVFDRYLTLGVYGMAPSDTLLRGATHYADEREQYFSNNLHPELYEDRLDAPAMAFAASSQVLEWLSIGIGATLGLTNRVTAGTFVGNSSRIAQTLVLSTALESEMVLAPHFGAQIQPTRWLGFSVTAHAPQKQDMINGLDNYLPNGDYQRANRDVVLDWMPWTVALGTQVDVLKLAAHSVSVVAGMNLALWSGYVDRVGERPLEGYLWANTLSTNVGLRHMYKDMLTSFVDFQYVPSPVPAQTGRTNYVDNNRLGFAAGSNFELPLSGTSLRLRFGLQAQLHFLLERYQAKLDPTSDRFAGKYYPGLVVDEWQDDTVNNRGEPVAAAAGLQTNNAGWPGFGSRGIIWGAGLNVAVLY